MRFLLYLLALTFFLSACKNNEDDDNDDNTDPNLTAADYTSYNIFAWGTTNADDFAGAVHDGGGNIYFTGVAEPDGYAADIFVVKAALGGTVAWAKSLDLGDRDYYPSPAENGHSQGGGGSRCIDIDATGNIYIAGTSKQGFNEVFAAKLNATGDIQWQQFWEADDSGLARGGALAYAMDEANGKVFITGSCGAGMSSEGAYIYLLVLDAATGEVDTNTVFGYDPSPTYNDKGYVVQVAPDNSIYIGGWEGANNSACLMKIGSDYSFQWFERFDLGVGARITDIDFDSSGNLYLSTDLRGVSTYLGILKVDTDGNLIWGKQYQGESNDRNNISCLRIIDDVLYVGGKGSFANYDVSQWGDACLMKFDLNGNLTKVYNYYSGTGSEDRCGERVEAIFKYNGKLYLAGEAWPEYSTINGNWYMPEGNLYDLTPSVTKITTMDIYTGDGVIVSRTFTESSLSIDMFDPVNGSNGSCDILIHEITE